MAFVKTMTIYRHYEIINLSTLNGVPSFFPHQTRALRDVSVEPLGDPVLDLGVTPRLVFNVRQGLDLAWDSWSMPEIWKDAAREYCRNVKIVASGGFNPDKIRKFEKLGVPVDIYAVGSSLFNNNGATVIDFTADVVRVKVHGEWIDMAKIGRMPLANPDLEKVW